MPRRLGARGGSARRGGQAERGRRGGSKVSRFHGSSLYRVSAHRRSPGGGTGDRWRGHRDAPCHRPGLVPAGQPGSAAPAGNAGFLAGRHAAGCGCRSEDLGTGPIMTLARLVITWIRADDRDGLPGSASPGNFLAQDSATYAAVSVISEAAPRPHAGGPPRRPVRHEYHRQGSSRTRGSAASDRGRPVPGTPATGRSLRTGRSSKRCPNTVGKFDKKVLRARHRAGELDVKRTHD